ncbi:MAG: hypothetical protein DCF25_08375 [Leptolyngbya foveolarum]|uniref:Uncharacterized protein n=1 Tax=Leptolyngbya foveolarum TaxID=47253 RepID=A0A2W4WAP7_9CYAN|nr:MAG: hypothetical protein DCF25_08375 [Leptolyngbya foveolarum]
MRNFVLKVPCEVRASRCVRIVAEGIAALITDTTKSGSSSAIGSVISGLKNKSKQVRNEDYIKSIVPDTRMG